MAASSIWMCKVFGGVMRQQVDICFIQETYSTKEVENVWKKQWKGEMYFSQVPYIAEVCLS